MRVGVGVRVRVRVRGVRVGGEGLHHGETDEEGAQERRAGLGSRPSRQSGIYKQATPAPSHPETLPVRTPPPPSGRPSTDPNHPFKRTPSPPAFRGGAFPVLHRYGAYPRPSPTTRGTESSGPRTDYRRPPIRCRTPTDRVPSGRLPFLPRPPSLRPIRCRPHPPSRPHLATVCFITWTNLIPPPPTQ